MGPLSNTLLHRPWATYCLLIHYVHRDFEAVSNLGVRGFTPLHCHSSSTTCLNWSLHPIVSSEAMYCDPADTTKSMPLKYTPSSRRLRGVPYIGFITPGYEPTAGVEARGQVNLLDLAIPLLSGMAAAYARTSGNR